MDNAAVCAMKELFFKHPVFQKELLTCFSFQQCCMGRSYLLLCFRHKTNLTKMSWETAGWLEHSSELISTSNQTSLHSILRFERIPAAASRHKLKLLNIQPRRVMKSQGISAATCDCVTLGGPEIRCSQRISFGNKIHVKF